MKISLLFVLLSFVLPMHSAFAQVYSKETGKALIQVVENDRLNFYECLLIEDRHGKFEGFSISDQCETISTRAILNDEAYINEFNYFFNREFQRQVSLIDAENQRTVIKASVLMATALFMTTHSKQLGKVTKLRGGVWPLLTLSFAASSVINFISTYHTNQAPESLESLTSDVMKRHNDGNKFENLVPELAKKEYELIKSSIIFSLIQVGFIESA